MRLMLHVMVVINLLAFVWFNYQGRPQKPELQAASKDVELIQLLGERKPNMGISASLQHQDETIAVCHSIGPLMDYEQVNEVVAEIKGLGREGNVRVDKQKVRYAYWVYLKSMPGNELDSVTAELEGKGITDYHRTDRDELSLGIYNGIQGAKRRQIDITALGYSPFVGPLYRTVTQYWIDIADINYGLHADDAWGSYLARYPDSQRKSIRCDLINA